MKNPLRDVGPGALVAAAFIGPGTVTVCTIAGAKYGFVLLWAMVFSTIATIVLQEMAARLGLVGKMGLATAVRKSIGNTAVRWVGIMLIMAAIIVGNAAYEAGNISGGVLGLEGIFQNPVLALGNISIRLFSLFVGLLAFVLLYTGNYRIIERFLVALVVLMSLAFLTTAIITQPNLLGMIKGMFIPRFPKGSWLMVMALIGTTVVPYNLFLHASLVQEKWKDERDLAKARKDTTISILLGGIVSMSIIICAASVQRMEVAGVADLATGLEPLFGRNAKYLLSIGLFAAGITSAITAPLAAAYVAKGCFGWQGDLKSIKFRSIWMLILGLGVIFSSTGFKPIEIIKFAQVANGILLPVIAGFLLWIMNRVDILGSFKNSKVQNMLGGAIVIITLLLGFKSIAKVFGWI